MGYFPEIAFQHDKVRLKPDFLSALSKIGIYLPLADSESADTVVR
jgi:hypothetical protein